jgi:membrane protein
VLARRIVKAALADGVTKLAASQTYYALMSLFLALIVVVALLALIGQQSTTGALVDLVARLGPGSAAETIRGPIEHVIASRGTSKTLLSISLLVSIFSASAFVGSFMWTTNKVYEVEGRPFVRKLPRQILLSLALMVALALIAVLVVFTGPVAANIGEAAGLGEEAVLAYAILRWPLLFIMASLLFSLLYHLAPNVPQSKLRWITPGGLIGVAIWLLATVGFTFYVSTVGSYEATNGALAGIVVFLFWLWIFNLSLLLGLEVDVELGRRRKELANGGSGEDLPV